jgi:3-oxoacyl-[acyl-carrier-protein] synthase II
MIRSGEADRVLVVAAEASVSPIFLGCFARLGVLPREGVGCRPFDEERDGFLMSEAATAVCLESAAPDEIHRGYTRIDRCALGGDATHMTGGDPDGLTLRRLLKFVVAARPVDLILAHGTGTIFNDPIELAAFDAECAAVESPAPVMVYSHKGALGHSLGASGLVSIALSCLMHRSSVVLPNVQTRNPIGTSRVRVACSAKPQAVKRSVTTAAGFGGPVAVISLESP